MGERSFFEERCVISSAFVFAVLIDGPRNKQAQAIALPPLLYPAPHRVGPSGVAIGALVQQ